MFWVFGPVALNGFNAATPKVEGDDHSPKLMLNYMFCIIGFEDLEYFNLTLIQNVYVCCTFQQKDLEYFNLTLIQNIGLCGQTVLCDLEYFNKSSFNATAYF